MIPVRSLIAGIFHPRKSHSRPHAIFFQGARSADCTVKQLELLNMWNFMARNPTTCHLSHRHSYPNSGISKFLIFVFLLPWAGIAKIDFSTKNLWRWMRMRRRSHWDGGAYEKGWDGAAKVFGCCFFLCFMYVSKIQHFVSLFVVGKIMFLFHTFSVSFCGGQGLLERFTWSELEMFRFPSPCLGYNCVVQLL